MILIRRLIDDAQYNYIANHYPGLEVEDYLMRQLRIWRENKYDEFVVDLNSVFELHVAAKETIPKSLRDCIEVESAGKAIAKVLSMSCLSLQTPHYEPDEIGSITLWYDLIALSSKRAERSLMRILDIYMLRSNNPYTIYEEEYRKEVDVAKKRAGDRASKSSSVMRTKPPRAAKPAKKKTMGKKKTTTQQKKKKTTKRRSRK